MVLAEIKAQKAVALVARALVIEPNSAAASAVQRVMGSVLLRATASPAILCAGQAPSISAGDLKCEALVPVHMANILAGAVLVLDAAAIDSQCADMAPRTVSMDAAITLISIETSIGNSLKVAARVATVLAITENMAITMECEVQVPAVNDSQCAAKAHHHATTTVRSLAVMKVRLAMMKTAARDANTLAVQTAHLAVKVVPIVKALLVLRETAKAAAFVVPMARHLKVAPSAANAPGAVVMAPVATVIVLPAHRAMAKATADSSVVPAVRLQAMVPGHVAMVPVATAQAAAAHHRATAKMMIVVLPSTTRMTTTKITKTKPKKNRLHKLSR